MNYQNFKTTVKNNLVKNLTAFVVLSFGLFAIFFSNIVTPQSLPDCRTITGTIQPGNNCLFFGLPLCHPVPGAGYSIPSSSITSQIPNSRVNCADLSDLPLCIQMDGAYNQIKDCVKGCNDPSFDSGTGVRGQDFAVHNRDCVRFCDSPEIGITANPGVNCIARRCHQLATGLDSHNTACTMFNCNMLTPDELNEAKFDDATKKYCDGSSIKCFEFTAAQLPYVKVRPNNTMCQIHNCRTSSESCVPYVYKKLLCSGSNYNTLNPDCPANIVNEIGDTVANTCDNLCNPASVTDHSCDPKYCKKRQPDDVQKILDQGQAYVDLYKNYVNAGYDLSSTTMCNKIICRPVLNRQFRCQPFAASNPTTLNASCDQLTDALTPATCSSGYCTKKIDCNLPQNNNEPECTPSSTSTSSGSTADTVNSWFYRPQPSSLALQGGGVLRSNMNHSRLCYSDGDIKDYWGVDTILFGWFTEDLSTRSPPSCGASKIGHRGQGYLYLCGTNSLLYRKPDKETAYISGYVRTDYVEGDATHSLNVCVRYNNTMDPQSSCGKRKCIIPCAFSSCDTQHCGDDVCRTLTLRDSNPNDCAAERMFYGGSKSCSSTIDTYVRIRMVKYKDYLCPFLDMKGTLAYDAQYYDGTEKMADGTCFSGTNVGGACAGSKNTNDEQGVANVWRTLFKISYQENNRPAGTPDYARGYLDASGRLFQEHECIKVPYRMHTPRTYNLANLSNSPDMFTPPLYIINSRLKRGKEVSVGTLAEPLGPTDFNYPEIEVRFGATTQKLSLGINYSGYEATGGDPNGSTTLTTTVNGFNYAVEIFVRKEELASDGSQPTFCLYRKVKDSDGIYLDPQRVKCVKRNKPEIDNSALKAINPLIDLRKLLVYPADGNTFTNSSLVMRYLSSSVAPATSCSSNGAECNTPVTLSNPDQTVPNCDPSSERHGVCVQREECSKLNVECMQNEIDYYAALNANQPTDSFLAVRQNCNEILLPLCNSKKGFTTTADSTIINTNANLDPDPASNIYGWFNELCIVSGFDSKLKNIIAYDLTNNLRGKCVINPASPYLTDSDPSTNCDLGGKAPNCLCLEAVDDVDPGVGYEVRQQTAREAGLCIDMPLPQTCLAIDYNQTPNSNPNDPEYTASSLNNSVYGTSAVDILNKVHITHRYRTEGKSAPNAIPLKGHAEFATSVIGTIDVNGECKGFWTYAKSPATGAALKPKLTCVNTDGVAQWEDTPRNPCVRYSCTEVFTSGPDINGFYQGNYGLLETGENKGTSHGFALWPSFTKTNDFPETVTANSCITGFKKAGALATTNSGTVTGSNAVTASLFGLITSYTGGTLPTRSCNQLGQWLDPSNVCQRITCPAINPPTPSGSGDDTAWSLWQNSGGATFAAANASRSLSRIQSESVSTGICNNNLGFFTSPGGHPPTRSCDYLGNWLPVKNPCSTSCTAITENGTGGAGQGNANNSNNGYATWGVLQSGATFYKDCNYGGWSVHIPLGDYVNLPNNLPGDSSSLTLDSGISATIYSGPNFTGTSATLNGNASCFVNYGLNDSVKSVRIYPTASSSVSGQFTGCVTGYVTNPYPPFEDINGDPLAPNVANDLTRPAENPKRVCKIQTAPNGYTSSVWGGVVNGCINQCPGATVDSRIGVGVTQHNTAGSGQISVNWPSTPLGQDAYMSNWNNEATLDASFFLQGRLNNSNVPNNIYLLRRHCGMDGKWSTVDVMCSANNGQINNSTYMLPSPTPTGFKNSVAVGGSRVTGVCVSNLFWTANFGTEAAPQMACVYDSGANSNKIDRVYLTLANGTHDCELRRCPTRAAIKTTRSTIPAVDATDPRTVPGQQVFGSCLNGTTNVNGTTVYTSLAAQTSLPHVTCNDGGVWSDANNAGITGDTNCKFGCDMPKPFGGWVRVDMNGCGGSSDNYFFVPAHTLQHGQVIQAASTDNCDGQTALYYGETCNDGTPHQNWLFEYQSSSCFGVYNPATNNFDNPTCNQSLFFNATCSGTNICISTNWKSIYRFSGTYYTKQNTLSNTSDFLQQFVW